MKPTTREWVKKAENDSFRYPGHAATLRETKVALKHCQSLRAEVRGALGLKR